VIEEQRFDGSLQNVQQIIVATNVRQLMRENGFHHLGRQVCEGAYGQQDALPKRQDP
jgi:hypothetical protein